MFSSLFNHVLRSKLSLSTRQSREAHFFCKFLTFCPSQRKPTCLRFQSRNVPLTYFPMLLSSFLCFPMSLMFSVRISLSRALPYFYQNYSQRQLQYVNSLVCLHQGRTSNLSSCIEIDLVDQATSTARATRLSGTSRSRAGSASSTLKSR